LTNFQKISEYEEINSYKDQIIATVSHDLKTPLTCLFSFAENLMQELTNPKERKELKMIIKSAEIMEFLIHDLIDFGKKANSKVEINCVSKTIWEIIHVVVRLFKFQFKKKGISFMQDYFINVEQKINSDPLKIQQILFNLLSNALKFTEKGGTVKFHISPISVESSSLAKFSIIDNGIGVSPDKQEKLFKLFASFDEKSVSESSGLGLTICHHLASILCKKNKKLRGMNYEPNKPKGSVFSFYIPLLEHEESEVFESLFDNSVENKIQSLPILDPILKKKKEEIAATIPHPKKSVSYGYSKTQTEKIKKVIKKYEGVKKINVLIVDDDQTCVYGLEAHMKCYGLNYSIANNGLEAIEILKAKKKEGVDFDLILMDCNMPIMNGFEATKEIKKMMEHKQLNKAIIVAITANEGNLDKESCFKAGMDDYIKKPVKQLELAERIEELLNISLTEKSF